MFPLAVLSTRRKKKQEEKRKKERKQKTTTTPYFGAIFSGAFFLLFYSIYLLPFFCRRLLSPSFLLSFSLFLFFSFLFLFLCLFSFPLYFLFSFLFLFLFIYSFILLFTSLFLYPPPFYLLLYYPSSPIESIFIFPFPPSPIFFLSLLLFALCDNLHSQPYPKLVCCSCCLLLAVLLRCFTVTASLLIPAEMLIQGEKYACEACVRGHRVSNCQHFG